MKKLKYLLLISMMFLISGCMNVSLDITINQDDSGSIVYTYGIEESFLESFEDGETSFSEVDIESAEKEDLTYQVNEKSYKGQKTTITFESLEELQNIYTTLNESSDDDDVQITPLTFERKDGVTTIKSDPNLEVDEEQTMYLNYIDYTLNIKVEGEVLNNNATSNENNIYTWNLKTILDKGVLLEYGAKKPNSLIIYIGIGAVILIGIVLFILKNKQKKQIN
ncbi:MAG: hypothetical protein GX641_01435 [Mollicutes bacterium]|nr:hypothetical protein [Mollicutes bacterium]